MKERHTSLRFLVSCLLLAAGGTCVGPAEAAAPAPKSARPPNFIVVFCDNLGYGDIGPFGSTLHRTPHLDRMAAEGRRFTDFYVTSGVCTPSRASMMTGCYPRRVNLHENEKGGAVLQPISKKGLHPDEVTIADILKTRGYATACIGKWHLGDQPAFLPTRQGFDEFFGIPYSDDMTGPPEHPQWPPLPLMRNQRVIEAPVDRNLLTKRYTEEAIRFITANRERPFFLYLPHATPGSTRNPFVDEAFRGKSKNGLWGDAVEELDWSTGEILAALKRLGLDENTLVVWTSDNGAPQRKPPQGSNQPLAGWGYSTAEGGMRVPCVVRWPGKVPAGTTCRELCSTIDLLPTLAGLAGARAPRDRIIDGRDIRPLLLGEPGAKSPHEAFYYYSLQQLQAVRSGKWKLYLPLEAKWENLRRGSRPSPARLCDLEADLAETTNLADKHPEVVQRLLQLAEKGREDLGDVDRLGKNQRPAGWIDDPEPQQLAPRLAEFVVPIDWKRLDQPVETDEDYRRAAEILSNAVFYNLRWTPGAAEKIEKGWRELTGRQAHDLVRPANAASYGIAVALKTGVFQEQAAGMSRKEALSRVLRLLRATARAHDGTGWKYPWQSALWAAQLVHASWLLWDELDPQTREQVAEILVYEADRFLAPGYKVPYWDPRSGNTKAEENAWDSMILQLACAMMPRHPHLTSWKRVATELMISSYAAKADMEDRTLVDGRPAKDWLRGYNVRDDGAVINHGFLHPDYMTCINLKLRAYLVQSLAGQLVPESADYGAARIWRTMAATRWPSPPYKAPGGTIYVPGRAEVYYPQGTDWFAGRVDIFYLSDTYAALLGWDRDLPGPSAREWMRLRAERLLERQARNPDRGVFAAGELTSYPGREQDAASLAADALLLHYLHARGKLGPKGNWLDH